MKKMVIIIIILLIIFLGMLVYRTNAINNINRVTIEEVQSIQEYITKIYMWKEVTIEALPRFENINVADENWIFEVIKKNLEEQELEYDTIQEELKKIFGDNIEKELPIKRK